MLVSEIISVAGFVVTVITAVATSSWCAYFCSRSDKNTIDLLKERQLTLGSKIQDLKEKDNRGAVVGETLSSFIKGADDFSKELSISIVELEREIEKRCMGDLLRNSCAQNRAQTSIETKLHELNILIQEAGELSGGAVKGYVQSGEVAIVGEHRSKVRDEIWKLVSAPANDQAAGIGTICIHGAFGVGKTSIAKSVHNQALNKDLFDSVIWVKVEYGAEVWQVQEAIAKSIECELPMKSNQASSHGERAGVDRERAEKLRDALLRKRRFLLVLDSLWQPLSLDDIGIPELGTRRKLMVTSRIRTVCDDIENTDWFEIKPLLDESEAWELFDAEMGSVLDLKPEAVASVKRALVSEFDGIPLAICKLAKSLRNRQKHNDTDFEQAWREELDELASDQHWVPKLFNQWKESYESLSKATRRCFLYCALFPKGYLIDNRELIEYWMWEGLLGDGIETLNKAKIEGRKILKELVNAHLLQAGTGECVKMLSLVRLMALDPMVYEERHRVFVRAGCSLDKLPLGHEWPAAVVERASFMRNRLDDLDLRGKPNCSGLTTLLLQDNNSLVRSHEKFFSGMPELKVLDLSRTKISAIPKSLTVLTKLVALLLRNCPNLKALPNLSNLQQVIVLDLSGTPLEHCPPGIQKMRKLRRLDLSQTKLATFPANVVSQLIVLEELLMITDHDCVWGSSDDEWWNGACIEDLVMLAKLSVLQLHFRNVQAFDKYVNMAKEHTQVPPKIRFRVGEIQTGEAFEENSLAISGLSIDIGTPVNNTLDLSSSELNLISLLKLKCLIVLDVCKFSGLTHLFSVEILETLTQLRELRVRSCEEMVEIVQQPAGEGTIYLPQLTKMELFELQRLKSICLNLDCPNLVSVGVWGCESLKLPMIKSRSKKIRIIGEQKWFDRLRAQGHTYPKFAFADECAPLYLITAATATDRKKQQESGEKPTEVPKDWFWSWLGQGNNGRAAT